MQKAKRRNKAKGSRRPVWLACLFLLVGLGLTIGAVVSFGNTITFVRSAQRASGKVMELERTSCGSKDRSTCYAPRVVFTDLKTGHEVEFVSSTASNPPGFRVGEQVAVLYDPEDPVTALIPGFFSIWGLVSILSGIGIFFVAAGGGLLLAPGKLFRAPLLQRLPARLQERIPKAPKALPRQTSAMHIPLTSPSPMLTPISQVFDYR